MSWILKLLSMFFDVRAASRGVRPYAARQVRKVAFRQIRRRIR